MDLANRIAARTFGGLGVVAIFALVIGGIGGWIWNIVKIFGAVADPLTALFVLRCVGVFFAPLGAILGFL